MNEEHFDNLNKSIDQVVREMGKSLAPSISYIGSQDDEVLEEVRSVFRWIKHVEDDATLGDVLIVQSELLQIELLNSISRKTGLVICQKSGDTHDPEIEEKLKNLLAVTLKDATGPAVMDHVKLLLLMRECFFANDGDCPIISVEPEYKSALSALFDAVSEFKNIIVNVDSLGHGQSIIKYLFEDAPESIKPVTLDGKNTSIKALGFQPYHVLLNPDPALLNDVLTRVGDIRRPIERPPLMLVVTEPMSVELDFTSIQFPEISARTRDCLLLACYASFRLSHDNKGVRYISEAKVDSARKTVGDPGRLIEYVSDIVSNQETDSVDSVLTRVLTTIERLSLTSILDEIEIRLLDAMLEQLGTIESLAVATSMAKPTIYRKRGRNR